MLGIVFTIFLIFLIASPSLCAGEDKIFNVVAYGAVGDGKTEDTKV
jgi:hypothetical protein